MVSVLGYTLGEYVFMVIVSYLLVALNTAAWMYVATAYEKRWWLVLVAGVLVMGVLQVVYWGDVRVGVVSFVNGLLTATLLIGAIWLLGMLGPGSRGEGDGE